MQVRRLGPSDAVTVRRAAALFDRPPDAMAVARYLADARNVFLMAFEGDRAVGFLRGTELGQIASRRSQLFLYEVGVAAAHRRRGVGRALITALLADCRARGLAEVFVLTDPGNLPAVALYRATGAVTETPADRVYVYALSPRPRDSRPAAVKRRSGRPPAGRGAAGAGSRPRGR